MSLSIRLLAADEAAVLERVADELFDEVVSSAWTAEFLADARHHLAVALDDATVVGFASGVHYVHPDKPPQMWINEVSVAPAHRQQGIARRLVETILAKGRELGCSEGWVLTEEENTAARALYSSVGGQESPAVMVTFPITSERQEDKC